MKNLRNSLLLTAAISLSGLSFPVFAGDDLTLPPWINIKQPIPKDPIPKDPTRPRAPSMQTLYFTYVSDPGICVFDFPQSEEGISFEMEHVQNRFIVEGYVSSEDPMWYQILPAGEYMIHCESMTGNTYTGTVTVE